MITGYSTERDSNKWQVQKSALVFFLLFLLALVMVPQMSFSQNNYPNYQSVPPGSQIDNNQYYGWPNPQTNAFPQGTISNSPSDNEITAKVRSEIAGDRNLSQKAQNISIMTQNGRVILQGAVISEYERTTVINLAERAAGTNQVFSQLVISP